MPDSLSFADKVRDFLLGTHTYPGRYTGQPTHSIQAGGPEYMALARQREAELQHWGDKSYVALPGPTEEDHKRIREILNKHDVPKSKVGTLSEDLLNLIPGVGSTTGPEANLNLSDVARTMRDSPDESPAGYAYGGPVAPALAPQAPAPQDPYATAVMSYADKVKALLEQRAAPVDTMASPSGPPAGPPVTGMLPGAPPENPAQDNMTINARSGEYVFPEPAVKYYGVKKLEDMVHKAIEDINPPGQPAPEPPTQAQTFAKGGLINRKHFLRLPKGHAYDKMSPKKHPLKAMPTGMPPEAPVAMDPAAMQQMQQMAPQQMAPPTQPTQPPLPGYWGGGVVWNNPDYWHGRNWDIFDRGWGPQVFSPGGRDMWNPNNFQPDLPVQAPDIINQPRHLPPRNQKALGGLVEPEGYARGGEVQVNYGGRMGHFNPNSIDQPYSIPQDVFGARMGNWYGAISRMNPYLGNYGPSGQTGFNPYPNLPGSSQGPTRVASYFDPQGYPYAQPVGPDANLLGSSRHTPPKKSQ